MKNTFIALARPCFAFCLLASSTFAACSGDDDDDSGPGSAGKSPVSSAGAGQGGEGATGGGPSAEASVARGEYLVKHVAACGDCHTPRDAMGAPIATKFLAGNPAFADLDPSDEDKGLLPAPNLTPDPDTGLGDWTDEQIKNAFLNGIDDEDEPLLSVMPYYVLHNMSATDADSIVMYLRSLPAVSNEIPERQDLGFPVVQAQPVPIDKLPDTTLPTSDPRYESAQNGRYLAANVGICKASTPRGDRCVPPCPTARTARSVVSPSETQRISASTSRPSSRPTATSFHCVSRQAVSRRTARAARAGRAARVVAARRLERTNAQP